MSFFIISLPYPAAIRVVIQTETLNGLKPGLLYTSLLSFCLTSLDADLDLH